MGPPGTPTPRLLLGCVASAAFAATLVFQWWVLAPGNWGSELLPSPDAVQYTAGAQSIRQTGRYVLDTGAFLLQPLHPPGWSALLVLPLSVGVPAEQLWRFTTLLHALTMAGLAWVVAAAALALRPSGAALPSAAELVGACTAALAAVALWVASPLAAVVSRFVMSDVPAAVAGLLALLLFFRWCGRAAAQHRGVDPRLVAAGAVLALCATIRPIVAAQALCAMAVLAHGAACRAARAAGTAAAARVLVRALRDGLLGAGPPFAACAWLLARSGFDPLRWSAYTFYYPQYVEAPARAIGLRYALDGNPGWPSAGGDVVGHGRLLLEQWLGVPGNLEWGYLGYWWPLPAAALGLLLLWRRGERGAAAAAAAWMLAHWFAGATLFVWEARFQTGALIAACGLAGLLVGRAIASPSTPRRAATVVAFTLMVGLTLRPLVTGTRQYVAWPAENAQTRERHRQFTERYRAGESARPDFDPVRAQALGLPLPGALPRLQGEALYRLTIQAKLLGIHGSIRCDHSGCTLDPSDRRFARARFPDDPAGATWSRYP